jgi:hypothetical protein
MARATAYQEKYTIEGLGKSNNPFFIERVRISGTHYKISSTANRPKSGFIYDIVTDKL